MSRKPLLAVGSLLLSVLLLLYQPHWERPAPAGGGARGFTARAAALPSPASAARRAVVLTMALNCQDFGGVQRFVASLRKHSPTTAQVVVFTDAWSLANETRLAPLLAMHDATVVAVDLARDLPANPFGGPQLAWADLYRWVLYSRWLQAAAEAACPSGAQPPGQACAPPFDFVMFSDSRDLVFQADIFAALQGAEGGGRGFYPILESAHDTVGGSEFNARWVEGCYGKEGLQRIEGKVVSCSGTSLGAWEDARAYAQLMADTMTRMASPTCLWADQGVHNFLLHTGAIAGVVRGGVFPQTHEDGFLVSLGTAPSFQVDHFGRVLNAAGALAAAVHQYDRWPALKARLEGLYPYITEDDVWVTRPPQY